MEFLETLIRLPHVMLKLQRMSSDWPPLTAVILKILRKWRHIPFTSLDLGRGKR